MLCFNVQIKQKIPKNSISQNKNKFKFQRCNFFLFFQPLNALFDNNDWSQVNENRDEREKEREKERKKERKKEGKKERERQ